MPRRLHAALLLSLLCGCVTATARMNADDSADLSQGGDLVASSDAERDKLEAAQRPHWNTAGDGYVPSEASGPVEPVPGPTKPKVSDEGKRLIKRTLELADEVGDIRNVRLSKSLKVVALSPKMFLDRALGKGKAEKEGVEADKAAQAEWVVFGLVAPQGVQNAGVSVDQLDRVVEEVLAEQLAGFYDPRTKEIVLPDHPPKAQEADASGPFNADELADFVIAHELEHAMQDQQYGLDKLVMNKNDEAREASRAVAEGEASLISILRFSRNAGVEDEKVVARLQSMPVTRMMGRGDKQFAKAPFALRELMEFPYRDGMRFVMAAHKVGGFPVVDQLFEHPPTTTEQVLHPAKYFAGESAIPVTVPEAPEGFTKVSSGVMGELGTRIVLAACVSPSAADAAASGWGGDAYVVGSRGKSLGLVWVTAWDSEDAARRFEASAAKLGGCLPGGPEESKATGWTVRAGAHVLRQGRTVIVERGLEASELKGKVPALVALVGKPEKLAPPIEGVDLHKLPAKSR